MARQGGAATRELGSSSAGLGEPPPVADISRDLRSMKARGHRTRALAAIPPNSHADLQWAKAGMTSGDFLVAGQTDRQTQNKNFSKKRKQNGVNGRRLRFGLVFCHGAHMRGIQEHADEDRNSN